MKHALAIAAVCLGLIGCEQPKLNQGVQTIIPPDTASRPAGTATANSSAVMATVNGSPVYMDELVAPLIEAYGIQTSEIVIANVLVDQEAVRQNVTVTEADIQAENDRSLEGLLPPNISPDARQRVVDELLRRRGISLGMWKQIMRRNALLRKIAAPRVSISEPMVLAEYNRIYGPKVQISHIQLPGATDAQRLLDQIKNGADFADMARKNSINPASAVSGGALPPFSKDDDAVAKPIREAAFALTQVGELSGIVQVGNDSHILRLDNKIPAENVIYADVKDKVQAALQTRLVEQLQVRLLSEIRRKADVEYVNPILRKAATRPLP